MQTNSEIKLKSKNRNIRYTHCNTGKYVVSEQLFSLKLEDCLKPQVEQRNQPALTLSRLYESKQSVVKCVSRITFFGLAAGKSTYCLANILLMACLATLQLATRYINTIICTCQVMLQQDGFAFCNYW